MSPEGGVEAGVVSQDGKWFWDGSRWSASHATVTGSVIPRILAWTLMGAMPLGALISLAIGSFLSKINSAVEGVGISVIFLAAEAVVIYVILARTPRITVDRGTMTVGLVLSNGGRSISVQSVASIEIARGSMAQLALTEGEVGEGRVLIHLVSGSLIDLGWDAFAGRAGTLAWLLGVPLTDPVADASGRRAAATRVQDPGREKRQRILAIVGVALLALLVLVLLFGPLLRSLFHG